MNGVGDILRRGLFFADRVFLPEAQLLRKFKPDLVLLVDYPGMNVGLAQWRSLRWGYPVHYVAPPQLWAYRHSGSATASVCKNLCAAFPLQVLFVSRSKRSFMSHGPRNFVRGIFSAQFHQSTSASIGRSSVAVSGESPRRGAPQSQNFVVASNLYRNWNGGIDILTPEFLTGGSQRMDNQHI